MEFKYRAVDNKPTTTTSPLYTVSSVSERILLGANEAFRKLRELEKEKIRREIITGDIVRQQELEKEVRTEMMMERALAFPTQRCLVTPFSFQDRLASWSNPIMDSLPINDIIDKSQPKLPEIVAHVEIKPSPEINKEKVITLPKPTLDLHSAKRKAMETDINDKEVSTFGLKKKSKEEWKCSLCQVSAPSEITLNEHLHGKKHKAKEGSKITHMIGNNSIKTSLSLHKSTITIPFPPKFPGLDAKTLLQFPQPSTTMEEGKAMMEPRILGEGELVEEEEECQIIGGGKNNNGKENEEAGKRNVLDKKKVTLWCEVCQICVSSPVVMETHKKGKNHLRKIMKLS